MERGEIHECIRFVYSDGTKSKVYKIPKMKAHTKLYMKELGYSEGEFIPCEISGRPAVDISHNKARGMGGRKSADHIENLMALIREWHDFLEMNPRYYWWFQLVHLHFLQTGKPYYTTELSGSDPIFKEILQKMNGLG